MEEDCLPTLIIKTFENLMAAGDVFGVLRLLSDEDVRESLSNMYPTDYSDFMFSYVQKLYDEASGYSLEERDIEKYNELSYLYEDYLTICESLSLGGSLFMLEEVSNQLMEIYDKLCSYIHKPRFSVVHRSLVHELPF